MKFSDESILGCQVEIDVDRDGEFSCRIDGNQITGPTLVLLRKKLTAHIKSRAKDVRIPFVFWEDEGFSESSGKLVSGVCVGIHAGNGNLLVQIAGGKTEQGGYQFRTNELLDPKDGPEYEKLCKAAQKAKNDREAFLNSHKINMKKLYTEAVGGEQ